MPACLPACLLIIVIYIIRLVRLFRLPIVFLIMLGNEEACVDEFLDVGDVVILRHVYPKCSPCDEMEPAPNNTHHSRQTQSKAKEQRVKRILSNDDYVCFDRANRLMEAIILIEFKKGFFSFGQSFLPDWI